MASLTKFKEKHRIVLKGVPASPGYAIGKGHFITHRKVSVVEETISDDSVEREEKLFDDVIERTVLDVSKLKKSTFERLGLKESRIFDSHLMILKDPTLINAIVDSIRKDKKSARWATHYQLTELITKFEHMRSKMMRERAMDLRDLYGRLLSMFDNTSSLNENFDEKSVVVASEITPGILMSLPREKILAFATDTGGRTGHVSILARSMQLPAVSGLHNVSDLAHGVDDVIVDGTHGIVILNPNQEDIEKNQIAQKLFEKQQRELFTMRQLEPMTRDGKYITLHANIELPAEANKVLDFGASGIGLFRSEFLFFREGAMPSFQEQVNAYSSILSAMSPHPTTIRTLDAGGDKLVSNLTAVHESNPFMGWRSIRVCLDRPKLFREQLKALLIASTKGKLRLLLPMISGMVELREAKKHIIACREELKKEGFDIPDVEVGVMIEVPSAVMLVENLAKEVDFFSIGTNDLIQFTLAVDRTNDLITKMFNPHHPAVLKMIHKTVEAAHHEGIPVAVCGEMSSDPISTLVLVGLGVDELSMTPWSIMECKKIIRSINYEEVRNVAMEILKMDNSDDVNAYLKKKYARTIADLGISSFISSFDTDENQKDDPE